jgi:hypothetical protein
MAFSMILLSPTLATHAAATRTYKKVNTTVASVEILVDAEEAGQAGTYVDGQETNTFIKELLANPESPLYKLKKEIELANCEETSKGEETWIDMCGEVTITPTIRTSFGRGGWAEAGAGYTFFIGFTSDGTGRFFDVSHMVTISEGVEAEFSDQGEFVGKFIKSLSQNP